MSAESHNVSQITVPVKEEIGEITSRSIVVSRGNVRLYGISRCTRGRSAICISNAGGSVGNQSWKLVVFRRGEASKISRYKRRRCLYAGCRAINIPRERECCCFRSTPFVSATQRRFHRNATLYDKHRERNN